jgi:2-keto-4-pentenoate hydratase/2-oxohepta-3-ene-1,7-dioic acid hydratase in catechol pathway
MPVPTEPVLFLKATTTVVGPFDDILIPRNSMTLEPGDLISTGTPPGVGLGMKPPRYLEDGDIVELEIQHLGKQRQSCRQE